MVYFLNFSPKPDQLSELMPYKEAAEIGSASHQDRPGSQECWSAYPACPVSVFNLLPDIYTQDHTFNISLEDFQMGSGPREEDSMVWQGSKESKIQENADDHNKIKEVAAKVETILMEP